MTLPSFVEHPGLYNVLPKDAYDPVPKDLDPKHFFYSTNRIPRLTEREAEAVRVRLIAALEQYAITIQKPRNYFSISWDVGTGDRSIALHLPAYQVLTTAFVEYLQRAVLAELPLWRICVSGESSETVVIIYPNVVRPGDAPPHADWRLELPKTVARLLEAEELREGPLRRQEKYVARYLLEYFASGKPAPGDAPLIVAAFDTGRAQSKDHTYVWFLYRTPDVRPRRNYAVVKPADAMGSGSFCVDDEGRFRDFEPGKWPYRTQPWLVNANYEGEIIVEQYVGLKLQDRTTLNRFTYVFRKTDIIPDERLKNAATS